MHLGNQNKTTKENGSLYRIVLLGLIVAAALFLQACASSATPSLVQLHQFPKKPSSKKSAEKNETFNYRISIGISGSYIKNNYYWGDKDSLVYREIPVNFNPNFSFVSPYFSLSGGVLGFDQIAYLDLVLGYWEKIQFHSWLGSPSGGLSFGFTANPWGGLILGLGVGYVSTYWHYYSDGINVSVQSDKKWRFFSEIGYQFSDRILISGKVEADSKLNNNLFGLYLSWRTQFFKSKPTKGGSNAL